MLTTEQLIELALFNSYRAMQAENTANQLYRANQDLAQALEKLKPVEPAPGPKDMAPE